MARLAPMLVFGLLISALASQPLAWAYTFTPGISTKLGYDSNVRLTRNAREDGFLKIAPFFSFQAGRPARLFEASGDIEFTQYFTLSEETGIDAGSINLAYHHEASPNWKWDIQNSFSSSFNAAEISEQGALVRIRERSGRLDRNLTRMQVEHAYGPMNILTAGYEHAINLRNDDSVGDSVIHHGQLKWKHLLNPDWRTEFEAHYFLDDYESIPDQNRGKVQAGLAYMIGPTREALLVLGFQEAAVISEDPVLTESRDYQTYSASLGYQHAVSPTFDWSLMLGVSRAGGDSRTNEAAGEAFPTGSLEGAWRGKTWEFNLYAGADLGEYELLGENTGLTYSQRVGARYRHNFTKLLSLSLRADYVRDNYQQDPLLTETTALGDVDNILLGAVIDYRITRYIKVGLDYRFLDRNSVDDNDDRNQNQIMLILTAKNPYRW